MKTENYIEQAIVQLLSIQIRAGRKFADLRTLVQKCLEEASLMANMKPQYRGLDIHKLGSVLRSWHKEAQYLTFDGLPRPLKTSGRSSLKTLIKKFYPAERFEIVFDRLLDAKLIKSSGRDEWVPSGRTARISQVSAETLEHLSEGIARYVETVTRNVTAKTEQDVLFERSCKVTKLPASQVEAFRNFVGQQALAFILAMDDWLESRVANNKNENPGQCTAGVYTFAYVATNDEERQSRENISSTS
jgi:hypothetical protein